MNTATITNQVEAKDIVAGEAVGLEQHATAIAELNAAELCLIGGGLVSPSFA